MTTSNVGPPGGVISGQGIVPEGLGNSKPKMKGEVGVEDWITGEGEGW